MQNAASGGKSRAGFSLLEVVVASSVALIALLALAASLSNSVLVTQQNREYSLAMEAARQKLEEIDAYDFRTAFAAYNESTGDDPPGAPGSGFSVTGLTVRDSDADGLQGRVLLPTNLTQDKEVDETRTAEICGNGVNLDLNGDGDTTDSFNPTTQRYRLLPVRVRIEWKGAAGDSTYEMCTVLTFR
jgi:prepilin-type N-terminal cleavage/methylation domain-containing protein